MATATPVSAPEIDLKTLWSETVEHMKTGEKFHDAVSLTLESEGLTGRVATQTRDALRESYCTGEFMRDKDFKDIFTAQCSEDINPKNLRLGYKVMYSRNKNITRTETFEPATDVSLQSIRYRLGQVVEQDPDEHGPFAIFAHKSDAQDWYQEYGSALYVVAYLPAPEDETELWKKLPPTFVHGQYGGYYAESSGTQEHQIEECPEGTVLAKAVMPLIDLDRVEAIKNQLHGEKKVDPELIERYAQFAFVEVRTAVAESLHTPAATLLRLSRDPKAVVKTAAIAAQKARSAAHAQSLELEPSH